MYLACYPPLSHTGPTCHPGTSSGADRPEPRPRRRYSGQTDPEHWCWSSGRGTSSWIDTQGETWLIIVRISFCLHVFIFKEKHHHIAEICMIWHYSERLFALIFVSVVKRSTTGLSEKIYVLKMWLHEEQSWTLFPFENLTSACRKQQTLKESVHSYS